MRTSLVVLAVCYRLSLSAASAVQPGFDPKDVVHRIRSAHQILRSPGPSSSGLDVGEFLVDTSIALVPAPDNQSEPVVAFDGVNFLVVWKDSRGDNREVYGARVTPEGTLLDPAAIVISQARTDQEAPAVAFGGTEFFVVWTDYDDNHIYGARVSPQGAVLDSAGIAISLAAYQCFPDVGFDGTNFLVAWQDYRDSSGYADIYGARVTPQGVVLDPAGIAISPAASEQRCPAVGFDGVNLLVTWEDFRDGHETDIYGARVTPQGDVLDSAGIAISLATGDQYCSALAFDGTDFLVAWEDGRSGGDYDIYVSRVTPAGTVLDPAGIAISEAPDNQYNPALAFDGANFLVAWNDSRSGTDCDIYGARVTPAGAVLDTAGIAISQAVDGQYRPAIAFGGANFLAVWDDDRGSNDIRGARVTPQGEVIDSAGTVISWAASSQQSPALAYDGTNFLVVWQDYRNGSDFTDIYGARVTPQGTVLDPAGFVISQATNDQLHPALAFDGTNYLAVWVDVRGGGDWDIYGARVTPQGTVLDSAGFVISQAQFPQCYPALAFNGTNFFVVWYDWRNNCVTPQIYGARITPAGAVLDTAGIAISRSQGDQYYPAVASDGANYLVVWGDWRSGGGSVYGARVTPQGTVLDSAGFNISRAPSCSSTPDLCFDGTNYLVVWDDDRSLAWTDIYGARVTPQGTVLDSASFVISHAANGRSAPAPAFDGANFLVAWQDSRSGSDCDIYGARVTPGGTVIDGGSILSKQGNQLYPRLCCGSSGQMFLAYQGWAGTLGGKTYNADRVWGMMDPNPGIEESPRPQATSYKLEPTIIRGVLYLPPASSGEHGASCTLLDISGREVMELRSGANDVRALAPGVYFVREVQAQAQAQAVRKIIISK